MEIQAMRVEVALEQPINKDNSDASIGGFAFKYADGATVNFAFEKSLGWVQHSGDSIVFELEDLDDTCSDVPDNMTAEEFVHPEEITEFYHEFMNDAANDTSVVLMKEILWCTFTIDDREYSLSRKVLEQFNQAMLREINDSIRAELR